MTSTRRFAAWWILASVPIPWLGAAVLRSVHSLNVHGQTNTLIAWFVSFYVSQTVITLATASCQSAVLARHRRRVRGWVWAALGGLLAGTLLFISISSGMNRISAAIAVKWNEALNWSLQAVYAASWTLAAATAEAFALWGRAWPPAWRFWLAGRVCIGVLLWFAAAALEVGMRSGGAAPDSFAVQLSGGAYSVASAAATAWLLDRVVFRTELEPARPDPA